MTRGPLRLAVVGDPIAHSRSPQIHEAAMRFVGLDGSYVRIRATADDMPDVVQRLRSGTLDGLNVTMPHKAIAARLADRLTPVAERAGAVNTLWLDDGTVVGDNTDVAGVATAWSWAHLPEDGPVVVLGSGGAAAAALLALEGRPLTVVARRNEAAAVLCRRLGVDAEIVSWETAGERRQHVLVNCTPLGMQGERLPASLLDGAVGLFEMAYGPKPTPAEIAVARRGLPVASGLDMLVGQAAHAFERWTGVPAPVAVMRAAAAN